IAKKKYDTKGTPEDWKKWHISTNGLYGAEGMIDFSSCIPEGEHPSLIAFQSGDTWGILRDNKVITDEKNMRISYEAKRDEELPPSTNRCLTFTVSCTNMKNYLAYDLPIDCYFKITCPENHADKEYLYDDKAPNCMEEGYTGGWWCHCCHAILEREYLPIDPDNHDFDYSNGKVIKEPTALTWGWHLYHCRRNYAHTITVPDIPPLPSDDGIDYGDLAEDTRYLSGDAAVSRNTVEDPKSKMITETVSVGGTEISKIVKDPESGKETVESKIWVGGLQSSYTYTGSAIKPSFHIYDGIRKLAENKDYSFTYKNNRDVGTATITIRFKGNYKGTAEQKVDFVIGPAMLGKDIIAYSTAVAVTKKAQKPKPTFIWASTGKEVSSKYFTVTYDGADSVKEEGTYTAEITPDNKNYGGTAKVKVKLVGKNVGLLSKAKVTFKPSSYAYTGSEIVPERGTYTLKLGGKTLIEGTDYKLAEVRNNVNPGTAKVVFKGIGIDETSIAGTKTATFKIKGGRKLEQAGEGSDFTYSFSDSVPYAKKGAKPSVTVMDRGVALKEGKDYTLSYEKNKAVTNGNKTALIEVKGKGSYKGKVKLCFEITKQSLKAKGISITTGDQFAMKTKLKKPSVTVIDTDGKKLKAGTDYTVGTPDTSAPGNTDESGEAFITITGKGNYRDDESVTVSFRYMNSLSSNLNSAKAMNKIADQIYTGSYVHLAGNDFMEILYTGKKDAPEYLVYGKDFAVTGYKNNMKKGTAKVTLRGKGGFAGTKTLSFKIKEKKGDYKGALVGDSWK
ncbi:MAG: hypothetical protein J5829_02250, partial [Lachnospiraceae bacterium]|nr:hypothetical protein [Lachnospiraceae bacterium]